MRVKRNNEDPNPQYDFHEVILGKLPPYGFGIAVSGGRDNPHFENGDPSIAVSDVLKAGPAEGRLFINDIIVSVNGTNLENVSYSYAIAILKDSPSSVNLLIKRRAPLQAPMTPSNRYAATTYTVNLPKTPANGKKKDDFSGLVLGCILYVKEINNRALSEVHGIQIGDTVLKIGPCPVDHLAFPEVKKVLEKRPKDRQSMVFQRPRGTRSAVAHAAVPFQPSNPGTPSVSQHRRQSSQNVYTELPTKTDNHSSNHARQKSADSTDGRLVNPPNRACERVNHAVRSASMNLNVSKSEVASPLVQRISAPILPQKVQGGDGLHNGHRGENGMVNPMPPPTNSRSHEAENCQDAISLSSDWRFPDPRYVAFRKDGSVGLRLTGGNEAGIFVAASQAGSPAALAGLTPGDKILKVNDKDMKGVTREEAVMYLLSLSDQIELVVQHRKQEFDYIIGNQIGDSFYIRTHFNYDPDNKTDLAFQCGDTFRVNDTLHTGSVGSWSVTKIGPNKVESLRGNVPSASRADELAKTLKNGNKSSKIYSNTLADRIRRRSRRAKSLTKDQWDEVAYAGVDSKFPAYERVVMKMPHFQRPIVFFGPLADIAREKLIKEFPDRYASAQMDIGGAGTEEKSGIVRLSAIRQFMAQNKHCVLDVTCQAVDRLNYAQMYPIVIFLKTESKDVIKEIRTAAESKRKSTKKLIIEAQKLEKSSAYLFTGVVPVKSKSSWFRSICELIEQQQQSPIWMSEKQPDNALADDFLFPMASNSLYSCASESDGENLYDTAPIPPPRRVSRDDSHINGVSAAHTRSPPAMGMSGVNGSHAARDHARPQTESIYGVKHSIPNLASSLSSAADFKENRPLTSQTYQAFPFKTDGRPEDNTHLNIFATLRSAKPGVPAGTAFSRRPRPPPITVPSSAEDRFNGKPMTSVSFADLPSISNGTPSTSGAYEDPKAYDPYRFMTATTTRQSSAPPQSSNPVPFTTTTLDRNHRHNNHHRQRAPQPTEPPPPLPSITSPSKMSSYQSSHSSSNNNSYSNNGASDIYVTRHPSIKEEPQAPPLPPKPKYLTNGRLRMFQQNGGGMENGSIGHQATYSEPSPTKVSVPKSAYNENPYGKSPPRLPQKSSSARPYLEPINTNGYHNTNGAGHRPSQHENFPFADDDRILSPSQMNFPPPPDDFLNSPNPNKLSPPEVIAEVRGFFDHNGGELSSEETGVSLVIPPGALPHGIRQEVYFKVCREDNILSTLDKEKGERLLSPCVLCGPTGLVFLKPLELKLPHSSDSSPMTGSFGSKSPRNSLVRSSGYPTDRNHPSKPSPKQLQKNGGSVSVFVDRF
ncbi:Tight junction protein ZO-1 [Hypsibius exemplaris]|uniref:Tight junction protein ZO-1 n=1 Tax=Hypsibius exemplaris TaxID=2072580 RepID=A0A1W0XFL3_HYPEX|nr:Tight junction protein ZO-1 [Hypsibius exemplaris]